MHFELYSQWKSALHSLVGPGVKRLLYSHKAELPYRSWYLTINIFKLANISFHSLIPQNYVNPPFSLLASHICYVVNPEMLSTKMFYDESAIYRSHGLRNCRMLICIYVAFFIIALISILIRSNDKINNIFICNPPRVFIQVSRPMFSTLKNSFSIIFTWLLPIWLLEIQYGHHV